MIRAGITWLTLTALFPEMRNMENLLIAKLYRRNHMKQPKNLK